MCETEIYSMRDYSSINCDKKQDGAALVVALVLVLVSTLLGVSAMQSSDIETQVLNNNRFHEVTFREAEAASDRLLTLENISAVARDATASVTDNTSINTEATIESEFKWLGDGPATGYSLGGQNGFMTLKFVSQASASIDTVDSVSVVRQGIEKLASSREN